ncbi:MAG: hypothetical protein HY855_26165 [Burkholderiales bacterium]|nr:hypothetical protein [Burkholderiales bacterium]
MSKASAAMFTALALAGASVPGLAADVGVSIGISQPGVYGRIDIGRFPPPVLVAPQPVWVAAPRVRPPHAPEPVYMWVPPGHRKHWHKHCAKYGACGAPVYFVEDRWYHQHVAPAPVPPHRHPQHPHR